MHAVKSVHANGKATNVLLDNNADVHLVDMDGRTAWDYTICHQRPSREIMLLLLRRGAISLMTLSRRSDSVYDHLLVHLQLFLLCVNLSVPRFKYKTRLSRDCIRRLREFLVVF